MVRKLHKKEVMQLSNENGNGHGKYEPAVSYRYLDADVWVKEDPETGDETRKPKACQSS